MVKNSYILLKDGTYGYVLPSGDISINGAVIKYDDKLIKATLEQPVTCSDYIVHEAVHTTSVITELVENSLLNQWFAVANPEFYKAIEKVQHELYKAYEIAANSYSDT